MDKKQVWAFVLRHKGQTVGSIIGLFLGFIFLWFGFWKMIFFAIVVSVSFIVGRQFDRKEDIKQIIDNILLDKFMRK